MVDEVHHLPALADTDPDTASEAAKSGEDLAGAWSRAIQPLLECASVRLLLSGRLERADGRGILWLPHRKSPEAKAREIALDAPGWAVIGYSRAQALQERAVLPVTFGALDGEARWRAEEGVEVGPHRLHPAYPNETTRPALFTALRTGFAETLLRQAFVAVRDLRARRREERGLHPGEAAMGLGKLLVVAPDQENARGYLDVIRSWIPREQARHIAQLATADTPRAHEAVAAFRLHPEPSILVTVAMAYEGLDVPEVAVVAALTHIRSRPWLEQMVARATRVDPNAGPYETQRALVFHPDDPLFQRFRIRMETEQGTLARPPKSRGKQTPRHEAPGAGGSAIGVARTAVSCRATSACATRRARGGSGRRRRSGERWAPRRDRGTRLVPLLQCCPEAGDGRKEPGADDAVRTGSRDRLARTATPGRASAIAGWRCTLRLVRPPARRKEAASRSRPAERSAASGHDLSLPSTFAAMRLNGERAYTYVRMV